jgi:hypothetical protein
MMADTNATLKQSLANIPAEYQDVFRQAIQKELANLEENQSDTAVLAYLRRRRDDFKRGGFIRYDGRPDLLALTPDAMYEQALPELTQQSLEQGDTPALLGRPNLLKGGALVVLALLFFFFAFRNQYQNKPADTPTPAVAGEITPAATPALPGLPEVSGAADALQTIGGLGGALTIGRPSAIELHYGDREEVIALAIDPSQTTPRGELRYNELTMRSANPVAVWIFGTVLNYGIGVPDSMVRNLQPGDRIILSTDTGASLHFVVAERWQGASYEAGRVLSQNRTGLTLFALPAAAEEDVAFAFAHYDVTGEERQPQLTYQIGEPFALGGSQVEVTGVTYSHAADGSLTIVVSGLAPAPVTTPGNYRGQTLILSLTAGNEQTAAVPLEPDNNGRWQTEFSLPPVAAGDTGIVAELRALPGGQLALLQLGARPHLVEQLQSEISGAYWDVTRGEVVVTLSIHNPDLAGAVFLGSEFIQIQSEGGDADAVNEGQVVPRLPLLIGPGETMTMTVSFLPSASLVLLQIGADLWAVQGVPYPTGQQPSN